MVINPCRIVNYVSKCPTKHFMGLRHSVTEVGGDDEDHSIYAQIALYGPISLPPYTLSNFLARKSARHRRVLTKEAII